MKKVLIYLMRFGLQMIYAVLKLLPTKKNKVVFLSRQSDTLTPDFEMVQQELRREDPQIEIVTICHRLEGAGSGGLKGILSFAGSTLRSMYHMATASVCVLDAYWPAVSLLHHKKTLTVIQMWHALGKIKQSGYQTLGKASGRGAEMAHLMKMHENYDYIIAGGKAWNPFYEKSFNQPQDKLVNCGLPRIDRLLAEREKNRKRFFAAYPELKEKMIILYAPTFRKNIELHWESLVRAVAARNAETIREDSQDRTSSADGRNAEAAQTNAANPEIAQNEEPFVLIVKGHPNQPLVSDDPAVQNCPDFRAVDLLAVCDYLITDYSAIALEGAVLNCPTYYFVYDYEEYREKNGMNIDLFEVMPGCVFRDADELMQRLAQGSYPQETLDAYRASYLPKNLGTSTAQIAQLVRAHLGETGGSKA